MGFAVDVAGGDRLRRVQQRLKQLGDTGLGRVMGRELRAASDALRPAIRTAAGEHMPSGYGPTLSKSLLFRQAIRTARQEATVTFNTRARGKAEPRRVTALNRGIVRHPLYGNRAHWYTTPARPGFVDRPVARLQPQIRRRMDSVVAYVADQIGA